MLGFLRLGRRVLGTAPNEKVGFIGLGQMGERMARNVLRSGRSLVVFDLNETSVNALTKDGATAASTASDVAAQCSSVITMLPSSPHVLDVYGSFSSPKDTLFIDASTIDPETAREVSEMVSSWDKDGNAMIDAPVSGGITGAEAGTLTFMCGGSGDALDRARPLLEAMGSNIVDCGGPGNGQVAKIANNLVLGISMIGVCEALNLAERLGLPPAKLSDVLNTSSGRCWSSDSYNPAPGVMDGVPASRGYEGGFASQLMLKDLGLACDAAKKAGTTTELGESAKRVYESVQSEHARKDFGVIFKWLQDQK